MSDTCFTEHTPERQAPLPPRLQSAIEHLTGIDMGDVVVHANTGLPGQHGAHALTLGNRIYLDTRSEKILAHEAWHVVQQKQGRVVPDGQEGLTIDDGLEREDHVMGDLVQRLARSNPPPRGRRALVKRAVAHPAMQPWIKITHDPNEVGPKQWLSVNTVLDKLNELKNVSEHSHPGIGQVVRKMFNKNLSYANYDAMLNDSANICQPLFGFLHEKKCVNSEQKLIDITGVASYSFHQFDLMIDRRPVEGGPDATFWSLRLDSTLAIDQVLTVGDYLSLFDKDDGSKGLVFTPKEGTATASLALPEDLTLALGVFGVGIVKEAGGTSWCFNATADMALRGGPDWLGKILPAKRIAQGGANEGRGARVPRRDAD